MTALLNPELWIGAFGLLVVLTALVSAAARVALRTLERRRRAALSPELEDRIVRAALAAYQQRGEG